MAHDDARADRPDFPSELPDGTTVADLPPAEIELRARFIAALFAHLTSTLRGFVAGGCPAEEHQQLMRQLTNGLELYVTTFRGAAEWRESHEEAVEQAVVEWRAAAAPALEDVPPLLGAALLCDVALGAEDEFWEVVRETTPALRDLEARLGVGPGRSRLH
jgi:hypothetical protein